MRMGIPKQHPHVAVSAHKSCFRCRKTLLEQSADRFMPKVVKVEILNPALLLSLSQAKRKALDVIGNTRSDVRSKPLQKP